MTPQLKVALIRALLQAFIQFGGVSLTAYQFTDNLQGALLSGLSAAFVALGYRGVAEGHYDQTRDIAGYVQSGDVTPNAPDDGFIGTNPSTWRGPVHLQEAPAPRR